MTSRIGLAKQALSVWSIYGGNLNMKLMNHCGVLLATAAW